MTRYAIGRFLVALVLTIAIANALGTPWLRAGGAENLELHTFGGITPVDIAAFGRGELGLVRPWLARRYLVQAYRVLTGRPPLDYTAVNQWPLRQANTTAQSGFDRWMELRDRTLGVVASARRAPQWPYRRFGDRYQYFDNCLDDAFANAARTLESRSNHFGASSSAVRNWIRGQDAVFANCSEGEVVLPDTPSSADPLLKADYEYQTAAAYFYAMHYEEAASRFRRIAANHESPWQKYGEYLAARATIRLATVPDRTQADKQALLMKAENDLRGVLGDSRAVALHDSSRGLLDFVGSKLRPAERLQTLSLALASARTTTAQDLVDYVELMDQFVGDTVSYEYDAIPDRDRLVRSHDLNDWVLAAQGGGRAALDRALVRWEQSRAPLWLVAVLWKLPGDHAAAARILDAAAAVDRSSPAYPTVTCLRLRLLIARGRVTEARALLATLPDQPESGFSIEVMNWLKAARLRLAGSLDEFLLNAPRTPADTRYPGPVLDEDSGIVLTAHLPLDRLVEIAGSNRLPARLRVRVAIAAFSRALVLRRGSAAEQAARSLANLAPAMRADVNDYLAGDNAVERHRAGVLLMLRTPGMHAYIRGRDDEGSYGNAEPLRIFGFPGNWWCISNGLLNSGSPASALGLIGSLYPNDQISYPTFVTTAERNATERERAAMVAAGPGQVYLAEETIKWARSQPGDLLAAEALARAVQAGRRSCSRSATSRRAFEMLHRLFPKSEWAKRTKYWYQGYQ